MPGHAAGERADGPVAPDLANKKARDPAATANEPVHRNSSHLMLRLQRSAGNAAVAGALGRPSVQRDAVKQAEYALRGDEYLIGKADEGDVDAVKAISDYAALAPDRRLKYIGNVLGQKDIGWRDRRALLHLWEPYGDGILAAARANSDLWARSVKTNPEVGVIGPLANSGTLFTIEVRQLARGILGGNDNEVVRQLDRLGAEPDGTMRSSLNNEKDAKRLEAMQKAAAQVAAAQDYQKSLTSVVVGYVDTAPQASEPRTPVTLGQIVGTESPALTAKPPEGMVHREGPTFEETLAAYNLAAAVVRGNLVKWPALYAAVGGESRPLLSSNAMQKVAGNSDEARKQLVTALTDTRKHITDATSKIEEPELPLELTPLHRKIMGGGAKTAIPWGDEVYKPVVESIVKDHNEQEAAMALGLGSVAALGFLVAEFFSGGLVTFLVVAGAGASVITAGQAIDKAVTANALEGSAISDDTRLIEEGKASEATVEAALASVFAVFDIALGLKAIAGSAKAAATGIAELDKLPAAERAAKIEEAVDQLGASGAVRASGKSAEELLAFLPAESRVSESLKLVRGEIAVETGLGSAKAIKAGAEAAEGLAKVWAELGSEAKRIEWLEARINAQLVESGAPAIKVLPNPDTKMTKLFFNQAQYEISISVREFGAAQSAAQIEKMVANAYHEARHAEQWWLVARRMANKPGMTEAMIKAQTGLSERVGKLALAEPLKDGATEAAAADRWMASFGTQDGERLRQAAYRDLDAAGANLKPAKDLYGDALRSGDPRKIANAKNELEDAQVLYDAAYEQYRKLPEELDAHGVNEAIEAKIRMWQLTRTGGAVVGGAVVGGGLAYGGAKAAGVTK